MNRRHFLALAAGTTTLSLGLSRQTFAGGVLGRPPRSDIPGDFCFYDVKLTGSETMMQAELLKAEGKAELKEWGQNGRCLVYTPEKAGDSITFRIKIGRVGQEPEFEILTSRAYFNNEGIYQLLVDGEPVGEPYDCFGHGKWIHGSFPVVSGTYEIAYRYTGQKNPKSAGTCINLSWLEFN